MNSIIVHEFEKINEDELKTRMSKNATHGYRDEFQQLIDFIEEFNATDDNVDAYELLSVKQDRKLGKYIQFKNYVGLIQLKTGFQIEVLPKIDMVSSDEQNKKLFMKMLRSLKEFEGKSFNISNLNLDRMNIYELFINMYLQSASALCKKGLKAAYLTTEDNLNVFKGKMIFKEQIKRNSVHKEKFYVSFDEYSLNKPENRLIKSTLLKLLNLSNESSNKKLCSQTLTYFENVDPSTNYDADFSKVKIDRNTKDYENLMNWSKVFLKNKSFTTFSGESVSRALLFPMEKLFESYVAKYAKKVFDNCKVSAQDKGYYLFNTPSNQFSLRPDLVVTKPDGTLVIMDTKWKNLFDDPRKNYGIAQSDMYQMYAYSKKYATSEIWLLYPLNNEMRNHQPISFMSNDNVNVHVFFVDVSDIETSLKNLKNSI